MLPLVDGLVPRWVVLEGVLTDVSALFAVGTEEARVPALVEFAVVSEVNLSEESLAVFDWQSQTHVCVCVAFFIGNKFVI